MLTLDNIYQNTHNYCKEIPANTTKQMLYGFGASFILQTIFTGRPSDAAAAGILSAIATAVHGLVTPLFKNLTNNKLELSWAEETCRTLIGFIVVGYISANFGNSAILYNHRFLTLAWSLISSLQPSRRKLDSANWIIVIPNFSIY